MMRTSDSEVRMLDPWPCGGRSLESGSPGLVLLRRDQTGIPVPGEIPRHSTVVRYVFQAVLALPALSRHANLARARMPVQPPLPRSGTHAGTFEHETEGTRSRRMVTCSRTREFP